MILRALSLPPSMAVLSHSGGSLHPTGTWGAFGFGVVDDWVLQRRHDALVRLLEG